MLSLLTDHLPSHSLSWIVPPSIHLQQDSPMSILHNSPIQCLLSPTLDWMLPQSIHSLPLTQPGLQPCISYRTSSAPAAFSTHTVSVISSPLSLHSFQASPRRTSPCSHTPPSTSLPFRRLQPSTHKPVKTTLNLDAPSIFLLDLPPNEGTIHT